MPVDLTTSSDFRAEAVTASTELLRAHSGDASEAGVSYCIPADADGRDYLAELRRRSIVAMVLGIGGIAAGGVIALIAKAQSFESNRREWTVLAIALACTLSGFAALFGMVRRIRRLVRQRVGQRLGEIPPEALRITLENAATYQQMKLVPDDAGIMLFHPAERCLAIEGITHRYLIHADDVADLSMGGGEANRSVRIVYRIGVATLGITVSPDAIAAQVLAGLTGRLGNFFDRVRACIG